MNEEKQHVVLSAIVYPFSAAAEFFAVVAGWIEMLGWAVIRALRAIRRA